jgi:UDP-3-O-[3-hydroxymyristoyl] N-acetylglucosamine deacetylase
MTLFPAPPYSGIVFQRVDLPGAPEIPASLQYVKEWPRCTRLISEKCSVQMVEHLLSALAAYGVDNLRIQLSGPEIPSGDGSSLLFVEAIEKAGLQIQGSKRRWLKIEEPVFWSENEVHLIGLPADEFRISYTLHYPQSSLIGSQYYSFSLDHPEEYKKEIAPCRTFSLYEEIAPLIEKGFLKGGGLENALVIKGGRIMNPEGARFPDEMVRHKVLDLIGDLALIGSPIRGHVIAIRSGHSSNLAFAKRLASACQAREEILEAFANSFVLESR